MKFKLLPVFLALCSTTVTQAFTSLPAPAQTSFRTIYDVSTDHSRRVVLSSTASNDQEKVVVVPYGEESRKYRRDVFGHEDWIKHRRSDRFIYNLKTIFTSGIWRQLLGEITAASSIALFVCVWNQCLSAGYTDLEGMKQAAFANLPLLKLPALPFTLSSPSLGLLLVFRTNASYGRWAEARQQWGVMGTENRNIMRMAAAWSSPLREPDKEKRIEAISEVGTACYVFFRSLLRHVSGPPDEDSFRADLREVLPEKESQAIIDAGHRPFRALFNLSRKVESLPLSERQRIEVDKACVIIGDVCGGTERIYGTPVPLSYTRHTSRFLTTWLFLLPLALYEPFGNTWNHIGMIPAEALIAGFFFGIEELSIQLEEPFSILALPGMVAAMKNFSQQLPQWHAMYTDEEYNPSVYGGEEFINAGLPAGARKITNIEDFPEYVTKENGEPVSDFEKAGWWVFK